MPKGKKVGFMKLAFSFSKLLSLSETLSLSEINEMRLGS